MHPAWTRRTVALITSLGIVGVVAATVARASGPDDQPVTAGAGPFLDGTGDTIELPTLVGGGLDPVPVPTVPALPTPEAAVDAFFAAEIADDFASSFGLLSESDRRTVGNPGEWAATHDELPAFVAFEATGPAEIDDDTAVVEGIARMVPVVDETVGIFPGEAQASIVAVREDGGWRIAFGDSVLQPVLPDPDTAESAAAAWLQRRQACDDAPEAYAGALLGDPRIGEALCGSTDTFVVDSVGDLDDLPDPVPFITAFGPDGVGLLRTVAVDGPRPLTLVVAPLGTEWVVVGAE